MSSRAIDPLWGESGLTLYNSNELTFLLCRIMPICVASTSVSAISQTPWNTACQSWHDVPVLFQNPAWQAQTDMAVSLWVSRAKYQFRLRSSSWPFCSNSLEWRSRHMVTWFGRHGDAFGMTEKAFFSCIYNPQITVSPTSSFSGSFNRNRVKNHPYPWTCPLSTHSHYYIWTLFTFLLTQQLVQPGLHAGWGVGDDHRRLEGHGSKLQTLLVKWGWTLMLTVIVLTPVIVPHT